MHVIAKYALGAVGAAYAHHVLVQPDRIASLARSFANRTGKPMLTFVPPPGATLKSFVRRPLAVGDMNLHPAARSARTGPGVIGRGSPYRIPAAPRSFGCVFSCDVLEHLERPDLALLEWHRIADRVFVVVPPWWSPEALMNRWFVSNDLKRAWPIWAKHNRIVWLPTGQIRAYDAGTCRTPSSPLPRQPTPRPRVARPQTPQTRVAAPPAGAPSASSETQATTAASTPEKDRPLLLPVVNLQPEASTAEEDYRPLEELPEDSSSENQPYLPPVVIGSPSSMSVSSMMIVSGPDHEND